MEQIRNHTEKPKVLHVSRPDSKAGGAAAFRTHKALQEAGYFSRILIRNSPFDRGEDIYRMLEDHEVKLRERTDNIRYRLEKIFSVPTLKTDPMYFFYGKDERIKRFSTSRLLKKVPFRPDVVIFYFVDGFINYHNIYEMAAATGARVFIYPMDMGPATGGCHYTWDCLAYQDGCVGCPAILDEHKKSRAVENLALKKHFLDQTHVEVLAASGWLMTNLRKSILFHNKKMHKLILPVEDSIFRPYDRSETARFTSSYPDKKIIFFGAQSLNDVRKGMRELLQSLKQLRQLADQSALKDQIVLLIAGRKDASFLDSLPFPYEFVGLLDNEKELPVAYASAHVFACPSLQDAGPMMINESVMCGTPVVAFDMGVANDLIQTPAGGYIARHGDTADFAKGLFTILSKDKAEQDRNRIACRDFAVGLYSIQSTARRLEEIFFGTNN